MIIVLHSYANDLDVVSMPNMVIQNKGPGPRSRQRKILRTGDTTSKSGQDLTSKRLNWHQGTGKVGNKLRLSDHQRCPKDHSWLLEQ